MPTTNFPDGVTNVFEYQTLGSYIDVDPTKAYQWFSDFDRFNATATGAGDWQANLTNTTLATVLITDADGGVLQITNTAADDDAAFFQWKGQNVGTDVAETFKWEATKGLWFKARFKVSDATQSDLVIGLQIADATPLDVTDGFFFQKADGATSLIFNAEKNNVASQVTAGTLANDTFVTVGFVWRNKLRRLDVFFNDNRVGSLTTTTNFCDDEELAVSFGVQNGEAVAKVLSVDYIFVAKER